MKTNETSPQVVIVVLVMNHGDGEWVLLLKQCARVFMLGRMKNVPLNLGQYKMPAR